MNFKKAMLFVFVSILTIIATACGNGGGNNLEGQIKIDGSSTVFPIMEAVAEEYLAENPRVRTTVGVSGTGGGFKRFVDGDTDLSNASRPIKEEEKEKAAAAGIEYMELKLAYDGLSVVVSKENDFVKDLTVDELRKIFLADGGVTTWSDVRSEWPNEEVKIFSPGTDSGTYDYWNEVILQDEEMRRDAQLNENDNNLVTGIAGDKYAIGFFGYNYYVENKDKLNIVAIDAGEGAVEPTNETIESGKYAPLSRPLYTYLNVASLQDEAVYSFVIFMLENAGDLSEEVSYVRLPQEKYDEQIQKINELKN